MKAKSRREIIEENKRLKREAQTQAAQVKCYAELAEAADKNRERVEQELTAAKARLARAGLEGNYEYTGGGTSGAVRFGSCVQIEPERVGVSGYVPKEMEFARRVLAAKIADELIAKGLVLVERGEINPVTRMQDVTVRLDVIPWDALTRRRVYVQTPGRW